MLSLNLGEFLYKLVHATEPYEFILHWGMYKDLLEEYQLIASSEKYTKNIYPMGLTDIINQNNTDFIPYFMSEKIFFLDNNIIHTMLNNEDVQVPYDYSIMLDTNYTSYIKWFLNGRNQPHSLENSTYKTLDVLLRNNFNYDTTFYLLENYMNLFSSGEDKFTVSNPKHLAVYENLYYVELFKSIDQKKYVECNKLEYTISENEARQNTDRIISLFYSGNSKEILNKFIDLHQSMTLLLIGIWQIQFGSKASAKNKMKKLFKYVIDKVGIFYEREMVIALRYLEDTKAVSMLNKINKGGKSLNQKELLEKVENIAWDFIVPRVMEFHVNTNKKYSYFIPFCLSHDKKLKELIKLFYIKGMLLHRKKDEYIPFSNLDTTDFFDKKGLFNELKTLRENEILLKREMVHEENINNNFSNKVKEIKTLHEILKK